MLKSCQTCLRQRGNNFDELYKEAKKRNENQQQKTGKVWAVIGKMKPRLKLIDTEYKDNTTTTKENTDSPQPEPMKNSESMKNSEPMQNSEEHDENKASETILSPAHAILYLHKLFPFDK